MEDEQSIVLDIGSSVQSNLMDELLKELMISRLPYTTYSSATAWPHRALTSQTCVFGRMIPET
ncbi:hypothetical protein SAMN06295888_10672 [Desulfonatronum zhilinae]|nr:hypothetical protein SAMN06295888_10672 [Desulfonatronum zhilinae]